jgi:hypothetical protein
MYASESGDFTTAYDKPGWTAGTAPAEDLYLAKRSGIANCPKNYICIHGARAPALLWLTAGHEDSCGSTVGKNAYRKTTEITEIPDDVDMNALVADEYQDGISQKFPLKLDEAVEANLEYKDANDDFGDPLYYITDNVEGITFWESKSKSNGVIALRKGNGIDYEADGGKVRKLQITAKVEFNNVPGKYIETQKSCNVKVNVRNSNDSPVLYENQVLNIEEYSPVDALLMTPVAASDPDEISAAQTFQFDIKQTINDMTGETIAKDLPFTIGKCSGILKVKNDVLRYNVIRYYKLSIELKDADDNEATFDNNPCDNKYGYCQKSTSGFVVVQIRNRNDPPVCSSAENIFDVAEHALVGSEIGEIKFHDEDEEDTHSFRISQIDGHDAISIQQNTGTFNVFRRLNYEKKSKYSLKVVVTDSGGWRRIPLSTETNVTFNVIDQNDAPILPTSSVFSINENAGANAFVESDLIGKGIGEDEDDLNGGTQNFGSPLKFSCDETITSDCEFFQMKNDDLRGITAKDSFNYEDRARFVLSVIAEDNNGDNGMKSNKMTMTVEVLDLNEQPALKDRSYSVKEDVKKGHVFGDKLVCSMNSGDVCSDPDEKQSHKFQLESPEDAPFSIDWQTGELSTTETLDHEEKPTFSLSISVEDDGLPDKMKATAAWSITVEDVNEEPSIEDNQEREVNEDPTIGQKVNKVYETGLNSTKNDVLKWTDPEDDNLDGAYTFEISSGDSDEIFNVSATGQITVKNNDKLDYEDKKKFTLLIKVTDAGSESSETSVTVHVRDDNEAPALKKKKDAQGDEIKTVERDIDESSDYKEKVGDIIQCVDDDEADKNSDGECTAICEIVDHYADLTGTDKLSEKYFTFDLEEDGDSTNQLVVNSRCKKIKCDTNTETDCCEKPNEEYNNCCKIPTFKQREVIYVGVKCEDTGGKKGTEERVKVKINEVNEKPVIAKKNFTIYEDFKKGGLVGSKMTAEDVEVSEGSQTLSWSITKGNSNKIFTIESSSGQIKIDDPSKLDYEELVGDKEEVELELTIKVEDNDAANAASDSQKVYVKVLDVNEKPELDASDFTGKVKENAQVKVEIGDPLEDFDDVDPENKTLTYAIVAGNNDGLFACVEDTGQITLDVSEKLDFETTKEYEITVRIYEPEGVSSTSYRGNEHTTKGGKLCQAWNKQSPRKHDHTPSKYPSAGLKDTHSCRDPTAKGTIWCYTEEGDKEWDYCDQQHTYDAKLTIEVTDVNEAPTVTNPKEKMTVYEDANNGDKVGKAMKGDDQDSGDSVSYSFESNADGESIFTINADSGKISVKDASKLDYETQKLFKPTIVVTDEKGLTGQIKAKLHILDVNEYPSVQDIVVSIAEDTGVDETIATLKVTDPDEGDRHTCKIISGNSNDAFTLDSKEYSLSVRNTSAIDYESGYTKYSLETKCTDSGKLSDSATITVSIYSVPEPPTLLGETFYINENTAENVFVFQHSDLVYTDQDDGGDVSKHTIKIVDGDPGHIFKQEGKTIKVNRREWRHNISGDATYLGKPVVVSKSTAEGPSTIQCPHNHKISFGFSVQQSAGKGFNERHNVVLHTASHAKGSAENNKKAIMELPSITFGRYSFSGGLKNANFFDSSEYTATYAFKTPKFWQSSGKILLTKPGLEKWGNVEGSQTYHIGIVSKNSQISQKFEAPKHSEVTLNFDVAALADAAFEIHIDGVGCIFPGTGGVNNGNFGDSMTHATFKYTAPFNWHLENPSRPVPVIRSCNGAWGGICTGSYSQYFVGLEKRGSGLWQEIKGLKSSSQYRLTFYGAKRRGHMSPTLRVFLEGDVISSMTWNQLSDSFVKINSEYVTPTKDGIIKIKFVNRSPEENDGTIFLDTVKLENKDYSSLSAPFAPSRKFQSHTVKFNMVSGQAVLRLINTRGSTVFIENLQLLWQEMPGPLVESNIEMGLLSNDKLKVENIKINSVSGQNACGEMIVESCLSWNRETLRCEKYGVPTRVPQDTDYITLDSTASERWRVSPLTASMKSVNNKLAMHFRKNNKFVRIENVMAEPEFTVSAWLKVYGIGGTLISRPSTQGVSWSLVLSEEGCVFSGEMNGHKWSSETLHDFAVWTHVAVSISLPQSQGHIFVNGETTKIFSTSSSGGSSPPYLNAVPILLGRAWDESNSKWQGKRPSHLNGKQAEGIYARDVAIWNTNENEETVRSVFDRTASYTDMDSLVGYWVGVSSNGEVDVDVKGSSSSVSSGVYIKNSDEITAETSQLSSSDDSPNLPTSTFKKCTFSVDIGYAVSELSECVLRNNKACSPGEVSCTTEICDSPGNDLSKIWAVCQPEDAHNNFPSERTISIVSSGKAQMAICPENTVIAFGWATHSTNDVNGMSCVKTNTHLCATGVQSCSQIKCDTPGDDIMHIYAVCQPEDSLHSSPIIGGRGGRAQACPADRPGVCNNMNEGLSYECPSGSELAFGFGLHFVEKFTSPREESGIQANMNLACKPGQLDCKLPVPIDTEGDDTTLIFAMCQGDLDYEMISQYDLTVEVTDPTGLTATNTIVVKIGEYNEQPKLWEQVVEVNENAHLSFPVGDPVKAFDPDPEDKLKFSIVGGNGKSLFGITSCEGQIIVDGNLDFETEHEYFLTVRVEDNGIRPPNLANEGNVTIFVKDVNEPPSLFDMYCTANEALAETKKEIGSIRLQKGYSSTFGRLEYRMGEAWGTVCGTVWTSKNSEVACRQLGLSGGYYMGKANDMEGMLNDRTGISVGDVQCEGGESALRDCDGFSSAASNCTASDAVVLKCDNPWASICKLSNVTDPDNGDKIKWAIGDFNPGDSTPLFELQEHSGILSIGDTVSPATRVKFLDHEFSDEYVMRIVVTDRGGLKDEASLTTFIKNIPEPPVFSEKPFPQPRSINENSPIGTLCGLPLIAEDDDIGETSGLKFNLTISQDNFAIDHTSGQIVTLQQFDFETKENYLLEVKVFDGSGRYDEMSVLVLIEDVNEPPVGNPLETFVPENFEANDAVWADLSGQSSSLTASDVDQGDWDTFSFSIVSQKGRFVARNNVWEDVKAFRIDPLTASIRVASSKTLDFEAVPEYKIEVRVLDSGKLSDVYEVGINVLDVNEPPEMPEVVNANVLENSLAGSLVADFGADPVDIDDQQNIDYSILRGTMGSREKFAIQDSGMVVVGKNAVLDYESMKKNDADCFSLLLEARDRGLAGRLLGGSYSRPLSVSGTLNACIVDVPEPPSFVQAEFTFTIPDDAPENTNVGMPIVATDQDFGDSVQYNIDTSAFDYNNETIYPNSVHGANGTTVGEIFGIDEKGQIFLRVAGVIEVGSTMVLPVEAVDNSNMKTIGTVSIKIMPPANRAPVLNNTQRWIYENSINTPVGTPLVCVDPPLDFGGSSGFTTENMAKLQPHECSSRNNFNCKTGSRAISGAACKVGYLSFEVSLDTNCDEYNAHKVPPRGLAVSEEIDFGCEVSTPPGTDNVVFNPMDNANDYDVQITGSSSNGLSLRIQRKSSNLPDWCEKPKFNVSFFVSSSMSASPMKLKWFEAAPGTKLTREWLHQECSRRNGRIATQKDVCPSGEKQYPFGGLQSESVGKFHDSVWTIVDEAATSTPEQWLKRTGVNEGDPCRIGMGTPGIRGRLGLRAGGYGPRGVYNEYYASNGFKTDGSGEKWTLDECRNVCKDDDSCVAFGWGKQIIQGKSIDTCYFHCDSQSPEKTGKTGGLCDESGDWYDSNYRRSRPSISPGNCYSTTHETKSEGPQLGKWTNLGGYRDKDQRAMRFGPKSYGYGAARCQRECLRRSEKYIYFALQDGGQCSCESSKHRISLYGRTECDGSGGPYCNYVYETKVVKTEKQFCYGKIVTPLPTTLKADGESKPSGARSCSELRKKGWPSGDYKIEPNGNTGKDARCDMETDQGGWTLIAAADKGILGQYMDEQLGSVSSSKYIHEYATTILKDSDEAVIAWGDGDSTTLSEYSKILKFQIPPMNKISLKPQNRAEPLSCQTAEHFIPVRTECIKGDCEMPTTMYTAPQSLSVNYGYSYGLVFPKEPADTTALESAVDIELCRFSSSSGDVRSCEQSIDSSGDSLSQIVSQAPEEHTMTLTLSRVSPVNGVKILINTLSYGGYSGIIIEVNTETGGWIKVFESEKTFGVFYEKKKYESTASNFKFGRYNYHPFLEKVEGVKSIRIKFGYGDNAEGQYITSLHDVQVLAPPAKVSDKECDHTLKQYGDHLSAAVYFGAVDTKFTFSEGGEQVSQAETAGLISGINSVRTSPGKMSLWVRRSSDLAPKGCPRTFTPDMVQVGKYCENDDCSDWESSVCTKYSDIFPWGFEDEKDFFPFSKGKYSCVVPDFDGLPITSTAGAKTEVKSTQASTATPLINAADLSAAMGGNRWIAGSFYSARSSSYELGSEFRGVSFQCTPGKNVFVGLNSGQKVGTVSTHGRFVVCGESKLFWYESGAIVGGGNTYVKTDLIQISVNELTNKVEYRVGKNLHIFSSRNYHGTFSYWSWCWCGCFR